LTARSIAKGFGEVGKKRGEEKRHIEKRAEGEDEWQKKPGFLGEKVGTS